MSGRHEQGATNAREQGAVPSQEQGAAPSQELGATNIREQGATNIRGQVATPSQESLAGNITATWTDSNPLTEPEDVDASLLTAAEFLFDERSMPSSSVSFRFDAESTHAVERSGRSKIIIHGVYVDADSVEHDAVAALFRPCNQGTRDDRGIRDALAEVSTMGIGSRAGFGPAMYEPSCSAIYRGPQNGWLQDGYVYPCVIQQDVGIALYAAIHEGKPVPYDRQLCGSDREARPLAEDDTPARVQENLKIMFDIICQMANMHEVGICHLDLTAHNICIVRTGDRAQDIRATIIDYNVASTHGDDADTRVNREYADALVHVRSESRIGTPDLWVPSDDPLYAEMLSAARANSYSLEVSSARDAEYLYLVLFELFTGMPVGQVESWGFMWMVWDEYRERIPVVKKDRVGGMFYPSLAPALVDAKLPGYMEDLDIMHIDKETIPDDSLRGYLQNAVSKHHRGYVDLKDRCELSSIDLANSQTASLAGLRMFPNLRNVKCANTRIETLDLTDVQHATTIDLSGSELHTIKPAICDCTRLYVDDTKLEQLDLRCFPHLENLDCSQTKIAELSVESCPNLKTLRCYRTELREIDLRSCSLLEMLCLNSSSPRTLRLGKHPSLTFMDCGLCDFEQIDLTGTDQLRFVDLRYDNIEKIDISHCPHLRFLEIANTKIEDLDLTGCAELVYFDCFRTGVSSIAADAAQSIRYLNCARTPLVSADMTAFPNLREVVTKEWMPAQLSDEASDETSDETFDATPDGTPDEAFDEASDGTPDEASDATPDGTSDETFDETSDGTCDV